MAMSSEDAQQLALFSLTPYQDPLPEYLVRESARARHVSLKVSFQGALEVVVPPGFDQREIPDILERRRGWITKTLKRIEQQQEALPSEHTVEKPSRLDLRSLAETWHIQYDQARAATLSLSHSNPQELTLQGPVDDAEACRALLRSWLQRKARAELAPWLQRLSQGCDLAYSRVSVRGQTSRWGSCSSRQSISLNYKLLFLPSSLVEYVLTHELCHTVHMNHSKAFWQLVQKYYADCEGAKADLKQAWQYIPQWVDA